VSAKLLFVCSLIASSFLGCTGKAQPGSVTSLTRPIAAKVIAGSPKFQECRECIYHLKLGWYIGRWGGCPTDWSECKGGRHTFEQLIRQEPMIHWLYTEGYVQAVSTAQGLTLTEKGKNASKDWKSAGSGWDITWMNKKLVEVTGIKEEPMSERKLVEFTFVHTLTGLGVELSKSEDVPAAFGVGYATKRVGPSKDVDPYNHFDGFVTTPADIMRFDPKVRKGEAFFEHYDDGWRLQGIE
jgi:hypothetical protein